MEFYAVTTTSAYSISNEKNKNGWPIVMKIATRAGKDNKVSVGGTLHNGNFVGITSEGIELYYEDHPKLGKTQLPEYVRSDFHGGHTSEIIALFLRKEEAIECLYESNSAEKCDLRWRKKSKEVKDLIGENHPVFIFSKLEPILVE